MRHKQWPMVCVVVWMSLGMGLGCGDSEGSKGEDDGPMGEPCPSPGASMTKCQCSAEQPLGNRQCREDKTWSACSCPPARDTANCVEGQPVKCNPCRGESEGRMTVCLQGGTFDCSCESNLPPADGGPAKDSGATDAGSADASDGSDSG